MPLFVSLKIIAGIIYNLTKPLVLDISKSGTRNMVKKIHLLDTSVLIEDPHSLGKFEKIYLPIDVVEELDKLKTSPGSVGQHARIAIKNLESGKYPNIMFDIEKYPNTLQDIPDNRILAAGIALQAKHKKFKVVVVSRDFNLRLKAKIAGLEFEDYETSTKFSDMYKGFVDIEDENLGGTLLKDGHVPCPDSLLHLSQNECLFIKGSEKGIALAKRVGDELKLIRNGQEAYGIKGKNKEQAFALDLLMDPKIHLVTLSGTAGTGKTLISLAAGLEQVLTKKKYKKMMVYRPIQPMGNDIGFTPGEISDKLRPWMGPIYDGLELLLGSGGNFSAKLDELIYRERISFEALTYIRGRSINDCFMVIDEGQNISKEEMKTILTRAGNNTKIIVTGDGDQVDRSDLDAERNGLTYAAEKFKTSELAGHISLQKGERSPLATLAAEIL